MSRTMKPVSEMAADLETEKNKSGYTKRIYKEQADAHKAEQLRNDIAVQVEALKQSDQRKRINWNDLEQVKERTFDYMEACRIAGVYPSVMGLAVHGFGVSRQSLNTYLAQNRNETTEFINRVKDVMADILTNSALFNSANAVQAIFQLKNHFGFADAVQIEPVTKDPAKGYPSIEEIERKYCADMYVMAEDDYNVE